MTIICMRPAIFSVMYTSLTGVDIDVFGHRQMDPVGRIPKNDTSKPELFRCFVLKTVVISQQ